MINIVSISLAIIAMVVALYSQVWAAWFKPFSLTCKIPGIIWREGPKGRSSEPFSLIVPIIMSNEGARSGLIDGVYVDLIHKETGAVYRLETVLTVDTAVSIQLASLPEEQQSAAIRGVGGCIFLQKYETRELGVVVGPCPDDALRYSTFTATKNILVGNYSVELWCHAPIRHRIFWQHPAWRHVVTTTTSVHSGMVGKFMVGISGAVYDTAPMAPLGESGTPPLYAFEERAKVRIHDKDPQVDGLTGIVKWRGRRIEEDKGRRHLSNIYGVKVEQNLTILRENQITLS